MNCQRQESLNKDRVFSALQEELGLLKAQADKAVALEEDVSRLARRCQRLEEEKDRAEADYRNQAQLQLRTIQDNRLQLQELRRVLRRHNLEGQELLGEEASLRDVCYRREQDASIARGNLRELMLEQNELKEQQRHLHEAVGQFDRDKSQSLTQLTRREFVYQQDLQARKQQDSALNERIGLVSELSATINSLQESIELECAKGHALQVQVDELVRSISEVKDSCQMVQRKVGDLANSRDCFVTKANHFSGQIDIQRGRRAERQSALESIQHNLRQLTHAIQLSERQKCQIADSNQRVLALNEKLVEDIDRSRVHLEKLREANEGMLTLLERHAQEDSSIALLIDRQDRIRLKRAKVDETNLHFERRW